MNLRKMFISNTELSMIIILLKSLKDEIYILPNNVQLFDYATNQLDIIEKRLSCLIFKNRSRVKDAYEIINYIRFIIRTYKPETTLFHNIPSDFFKAIERAEKVIAFCEINKEGKIEFGTKIIGSLSKRDKSMIEKRFVFISYFDGCLMSDLSNEIRATDMNIVIEILNRYLIHRMTDHSGSVETEIVTSLEIAGINSLYKIGDWDRLNYVGSKHTKH